MISFCEIWFEVSCRRARELLADAHQDNDVQIMFGAEGGWANVGTSRSTSELVEQALDPDWVMAEPAIYGLHRRGSSEVLDAALAMATGMDPFRRGRAADILGQLGSPNRQFADECWRMLARLARHDPEPAVQAKAALSLGLTGNARSVPILLELRRHPDSNVRYAVVHALDHFHDEDPEITSPLLELMEDPDEDVRDWATFALGSHGSDDNPVIRDALLARTTDPHGATRQEALVGLAKRGDQRAIAPLIAELDHIFSNALQEAAACLLGIDESELEDVEIEEIIDRLKALQPHDGAC
jgi:HEAT repeat protein